MQKSDWIGLLNEATPAGILEDLGGNLYKIHPALPWYLRQQLDKMNSQEVISNLEKKLLVFYAILANNYHKKLISNAQLGSFVLRVEEPNLFQQLRLAEQQQDWANAQAILQALGEVYQRWVRKPEFKSLRQRALNQIGLHLALAKAKGKDAFDFWMYLRGVDANEAIESADLETARVVYQEILDELTALNDPSVNDKIAGVYHQLGRVAQEQRWFDEAITFYHKSLQIFEDAGDFYSAASDYHHLGMVAQEQRRFDDAIAFYHKSLPIYEDAKDFYSAAREYHQLGIVAQEQRRFDDAIAFYHKSLQICEDVGDFYNAAKQYHNLGYIAQEQQRFDEAIAFYRKALQILEDVGDFYKVASVYNNLGALAHKQQRFDDAIAFYNKALKIREDAGDFRSAANQYQGLGNIAKEQGDFDTAVAYFQKAFTALSAANDWRQASSTLTAWGRTLEAESNWTEAVKIYIQALAIDIKHNSEFVGSDIGGLGQMVKQLGDSQFQVIWREFTGDECPGELFSAIQKASSIESS